VDSLGMMADQQFLIPIETLKGYENYKEIISEMKQEDVLILGYEDMSAELLIDRPNLNSMNPLTIILFNLLIEARKQGITMIDAVFRGYSQKQEKELKEECEFTSKLGLTSKVCIHPNQVKIVNQIFAKTKKAYLNFLEEGKRKIETAVKEQGVSVSNIKERMIDEPLLKAYKLIKEKWHKKK